MLVPDDDLIQGAVDGTLTDQEQAELAQLLARSEPSRANFQSLMALSLALNEVPLVPAPAIRDSVMQRIRSTSRPLPATSVAWRGRGRRRAFVLGWAAAAAVVIAVGLQQMPRGNRANPSHAGGAMTRVEADDWTTVARFAREGSTLIVRQNGDQFAFQSRVATGAPVTIEWDPARLSFAEAGESAELREIKRGRVSFPTRTRPVSLVLSTRNRSETTIVRVTAAGKELFQWAVGPP